MASDINTLFQLTMYVEATLGLLMLLVWLQNLAAQAVAWWGVSHLLRSLSLALFGLFGILPDLITIDLAAAILFISYGATWTGARVFEGRDPRPGSIVTGATLWILACQIPGFLDATSVRQLICGSIIGCFSWLAAYEFWRGRSESLISRWPTIFLLFFQGAVFMLRTPLSSIFPEHQGGALSSAWWTIISPEALLLPISTAFVLVALVKERSELRQRVAAQIDPLTGLPNRRGFMQAAELLVQALFKRGQSVGMLVLDLDNFKSINDRYGHEVGDSVLALFGTVAKANLRPSDAIGRIGGEEFAILLGDADREKAVRIAERIRSEFEAAANLVNERPLAATISVGVSINQDGDEALSTLLRRADQALYRAKAGGRNCVEVIQTNVLQLGVAEASAAA